MSRARRKKPRTQVGGLVYENLFDDETAALEQLQGWILGMNWLQSLKKQGSREECCCEESPGVR